MSLRFEFGASASRLFARRVRWHPRRLDDFLAIAGDEAARKQGPSVGLRFQPLMTPWTSAPSSKSVHPFLRLIPLVTMAPANRQNCVKAPESIFGRSYAAVDGLPQRAFRGYCAVATSGLSP